MTREANDPMNRKIFFGGVLAAMCACVGGRPQAGVLGGPITNPANGHQYFILTEDTWQSSATQALGLGGHLVTIDDANEQQWIFKTFGSFAGRNRSLWIVLWDVTGNGTFGWTSSDPVQYTHWLEGQPDHSPVTKGERFVHMINTGNLYGHPGGYWNDLASPNTAFGTFDPDRKSTRLNSSHT